ncbi:MAG TPA: SMP-30/gluconolactonase/LRE family protein [Steroidobacteraceae bacterium]|nr:SMP-30/gluconolactonase/LRE family protein [Steroidobacteraceae bacterium]
MHPIDRRGVLKGACAFGTALAAAALHRPAFALAASTRVDTIPASEVRILTTDVHGPEGPSELPDGSVAMVEFTVGDIIRVSPQGVRDVLAKPGVGVAGTALGHDNALYVAKMNLSSFMRRPPGGAAPGSSPPAGPPPPGGAADGGQGGSMPAADSSPSAVVRIDLATKESKLLYSTYEGKELGGPNDFAVDAWGDLWFSDVPGAGVFNARTDGSHLERMISEVPGVNGLALSPDKKTLYLWTAGKLLSYRIKGRGQLESGHGKPHARKFADWPAGIHEPDGMKMEAGGNLLCACWEDGLLVFSPQGELLSQTKVQDLSVINAAFGGKDLKTLYLAAHPANNMVGVLAAIAWPRAGLR